MVVYCCLPGPTMLVRNLFLVLAFISLSLGWIRVGAQLHHVVGYDRGWDVASGIASWSSGRIFSVGDTLWFAYSAAQDSVAEVKSKEEFESCNATNPIKIYTNGLDSIPLEEEGFRYFVSGNAENCKEGLKLHVDIHAPRPNKPEIHTVVTSEGVAMAVAYSPSSTSGSAHLVADTCTSVLLASFIYFFMSIM